MPEPVEIVVDGRRVVAAAGLSLAAVLLDAGVTRFGAATGDLASTPICGMGICFGCRVRIGGRSVRACRTRVEPGMEVRTGA